MLYFRRKQIKLSLIEDYIKIKVLNNFFCNSFENIKIDESFLKLKTQVDNLLKTYTYIFKKLKMYDLSLLILNKELKNTNNLFEKEQSHNFSTLKETLTSIEENVNKIYFNLKKKLKSLKLSSFYSSSLSILPSTFLL